MNEELINYLKVIKKRLVSKELRGQEWEERMEVLEKLEDAVTYLNDCSERFSGSHVSTITFRTHTNVRTAA